MATAAADNIQTDWTVDEAFCYLTETVGLRDYDAIHQMTERIRSGRLSVRVNGNSPPPTLWVMGQLVLTIDTDGRAQVTPTVGMEPWPRVFTVTAEQVRRLWRPPSAKAVRIKERPRDHVVKLFNGLLKGKIKPGMRAADAHTLVRPHYKTSRETIERALKDWDDAK